MTFVEYQKQSRETAIYPHKDNNLTYPVLGLAGEAGEICNKVKKIMRDNDGVMPSELYDDLANELGDVLWYVAAVASELNLDLDTIAINNIKRLIDRKKRNVLHGSGSNR